MKIVIEEERAGEGLKYLGLMIVMKVVVTVMLTAM